jgi:hypothetical protein
MGLYTPQQVDLLLYLPIVPSALSLAGATLIFTSIILFKPLRRPSYTLVAMLSLCDIGFAAGFFLFPTEDGPLCQFQVRARGGLVGEEKCFGWMRSLWWVMIMGDDHE